MVNETIPSQGLEEQILSLDRIKARLTAVHSIEEKMAILSQEESVQTYLQKHPEIESFLKALSPAEEFAIKSIIAIEQGPNILSHLHADADTIELKRMIQVLLDLEQFYSGQGGIVGYHEAVLNLIVSHEKNDRKELHISYQKPTGLDITSETEEVIQAIFWGIQSLPDLAEIYPVGGAADRLDLHEESTGTPLPAAMLLFEGRTLLEGLIRDIQAREYLYYKLYHKQVMTPIAMMTSEEKSNHTYIVNLLKDNDYFNRPSEKFFFFLQPLVPVITKEGNWSLSAPLHLTLKPGGHGVIWKVAQDNGALEWLARDRRTVAIIRQINNPIAGTDHTLLALAGLGYEGKKAFGFLSCDRLLNCAEGVNILKEEKMQNGFDYCISNVEYTDMKLKGIKEVPISPGSPYSQYPSNTNVLFANLTAVQEAVAKCPIPGQLINMKTKVPSLDPQGVLTQVDGGRLESLMQNIADYLTDHFPHKITPKETSSLKTFIAYNDRKKTISTTKKLYHEKESPVSTPEYALYDRLSNHRELMSEQCGFSMPLMPSMDDYLSQGPSFIVLFHPALGPLYSVIGQKIRGGALAPGSEMQLEIAEFDSENLNLDGSLLIYADQVMGGVDKEKILLYGESTGKCTLRNVSVQNRGINKQAAQCYWKNEIIRNEALRIYLSGNAEFVAENVTFKGNYDIHVPSGCRLVAYQEKENLVFRKEIIDAPTWSWSYSFDDKNHIVLEKKSSKN